MTSVLSPFTSDDPAILRQQIVSLQQRLAHAEARASALEWLATVHQAPAIGQQLGPFDDQIRRLSDEHGLLAAALDSLETGVVISDPRQPENPLIYVNAGFTNLTGYTQSDALGQNCRFLQGADTDPQAVQLLQKALDAQRQIRIVLRNYRKDGTPFWNELSISPVFNSDGVLTHFVGIQVDVSERIEAEQMLQRRDAILQAVSFVARQFIEHETWEAAMPAALERLGQATDAHRVYLSQVTIPPNKQIQIIGRSEWCQSGIPALVAGSVYDVELSEQRFTHWQSLFQERQSIAFNRHMLTTAERSPVEMRDAQSVLVVPVILNGQPWGYLGFDDCVHADRQWTAAEIDALNTAAGLISTKMQRQQAQAELRQNQLMVEGLLANAPFGILVKTYPGEKYVLVNRPIAEQFGITPEAMRGKTMDEVVPATLIEQLKNEDRTVIQTGEPLDYESEVTLNGETSHVYVVKFPIYNNLGQIEAIGGFYIDMTARHTMEKELHERREFITRLLEAGPVSIALRSYPEGRYLMVNQALANWIGQPASTIVGQHFTEFFSPDRVSTAQEEDRQVIESRGPLQFEGTMHHAEGGTRAFAAIKFPVFNLQKEIYAIGGMYLDITDRKQMEEELRQLNTELEERVQKRTSELEAVVLQLQLSIHKLEETQRTLRSSERFILSITSTLPSLIYLYDLTTFELVYSSRTIAAFFGLEVDNNRLLFETLAPLVPSDDLQRMQFHRAQHYLNSDGIVIEGEFRLRREEQAVRWFSTHETIFSRHSNGAPHQILGIAQDITARKRVEADLETANQQLARLNHELYSSKTLLETLFDNLEDGLMLIDNQGHVLTVNQPFATLFGLEPPQMVNVAITELRRRTETNFPDDWVLEALNARYPRQQRVRLDQANGRSLILDMSVLPLVEQQRVEQVIIHTADITNQLKLETQVIEQERIAASGRVAATVAHEVNTPLQSIESCLHLAETGTPEERSEFLAVAREELLRVGEILRKLLNLYRPNADTLKLVDLALKIEQALTQMRQTLEQQQIEVHVVLQPNLPRVYARADEVVQMLLSIVFNAVEAMPHGGTLSIKTAVRDLALTPSVPSNDEVASDMPEQLSAPFVVVDIQDTGVGMSPHVLERIFEPFYTTKSQGHGMNLTICRQIIHGYGGQIMVQSEPNVGSLFTLAFPMSDQVYDEETPE
jgi:PAS domain S-box-containing protein